MSMIFCRGCAKEIHETAPTCPQCGALQGSLKINNATPNIEEQGKAHNRNWSSILALVFGVFGVLILFAPTEEWSQDEIAGVIFWGCIPLIFGIISLVQKQADQWMAITGLVLGGLMLLIALGSI